MKIIENPRDEHELIKDCIKKYGHAPDHNFDWLMSCADEGEPRVAIWDDGCTIWGYQNKEEWILVSDPISPKDEYQEKLSELINYVLNLGSIRKITFLDVRDGVHGIVRNLYSDQYEFDYEIVWPVVQMDLFDDKFSGNRFKEIRNALNKFNREHGIEIKEINQVSKKSLHKIVDDWTENRIKAGIEELYPARYHNIIDNDFRGTDSARVVLVDGNAVGFNAGWKTPNKPGDWSAAVGIHDYSVKDLGIVLLAEDLIWIKNSGYKTCDLEGSDPQALRFKTQFIPKGYDSYKTFTFCIKK